MIKGSRTTFVFYNRSSLEFPKINLITRYCRSIVCHWASLIAFTTQQQRFQTGKCIRDTEQCWKSKINIQQNCVEICWTFMDSHTHRHVIYKNMLVFNSGYISSVLIKFSLGNDNIIYWSKLARHGGSIFCIWSNDYRLYI